ncbi:hypothetical protein Dsin_011845 [Dipteronia sinensis]|uniref:RNase H type-1 domain-containing protein n=1 Tax=Dipteronia sinensis TaxID=43782 RepID=A0AAE0AHV8_9ROSI|nr:hypothetical protein Dsin_011845 [Dipteronia sinensis]
MANARRCENQIGDIEVEGRRVSKPAEIISGDFMNFLAEFYLDGATVKAINQTFITLIPKCSRLGSLKDFRPISLVTSMYKLLAKVLANRVKKVMGSIIGEVQMAFVSGRQIIDGFVIAEEIIHKWKNDKNGGLLVKLFVKANELDLMRGAIFEGNNVHISHLQFADDTMLFLQPRVDYLLNAKRILRCFELASGLRMNFHKSSVTRIGKVGMGEEDWAKLFLCKEGSLSIPYLGLPLGGRPSAKAFWNSVVSRIENRLTPWKRYYLNKSGSLFLIKAVLASIPINFMSVFKIPIGEAKTIERLQRNFFWGDDLGKKKLHLVNWESMCKRKDLGGLGIGRVGEKNSSLLARWIWRFGLEKESLWKKVLCAKYHLQTSSLRWDWNCTPSNSPFVKAVSSICNGSSTSANILNDGIKVMIGNGCRARSFRKSFERAVVVREEVHNYIWQRICPPKIETFAWQLLRGRIPVKDALQHFGCGPASGLDMDRFRVAWWFKHHGKGCTEPVTTILLNLRERCVDKNKVKTSKLEEWIPPALDSFKFNVDGSACGIPGPAGMGVSYETSTNGKILCLFSSFLGFTEAITAEICAIQKACDLCYSRHDTRGRKITIVSDSKVVDDWINNDGIGSVAHLDCILDIRNKLSFMTNTVVIFNPRGSNSFANMLAKRASSNGSDMMIWSL